MFQPSSPISEIADLSSIPISYSYPQRFHVGCNGPAKRIFDIVVASFLLALACIPMLIIAVLIRCDSPGPALFRQRRIGFSNGDFEALKFRTMWHEGTTTCRLRQACRDDARVTDLGAWLRRWSLDELPQLINVLRGEMSLVGPRPHAPGTCAGGKPFELVTPRYPARHCVRPGMTGLAQVRGLRGETETEEKLLRRVDADLEYIEHWSLWLDAVILARTAGAVFAACNAY